MMQILEKEGSTSEAPIQAVIFDFGNVICRFDNRRALQALALVCGQTPELLERLVVGSGLSEAYESGALDSRSFLTALSELCGHAFEEDFFVRAFTDIFTPIPSTFELIQRLHGRYRLGLLSNTNPWHFEHGIRTTEVFTQFTSVTLSYEVGALKPDPRIYDDALAKLDLPAAACVYIDDIPAFAQAAAARGLHGLTYTTPEVLLAELKRLQVTF
jgi:putative hydrolase of the HAD superfamily